MIGFWSCDNGHDTPNPINTTDSTGTVGTDSSTHLTIFYINDQHGHIDNFAKIKHIVDGAKDSLNVLLVCAGDIFSGNPIVDQYSEKGYPMIDVMNQAGFDVSEIGNHEFDYGQETLAKRLDQAEFKWVCANVNVEDSGLPQPPPYVTLQAGNLDVTFLGFVETNGKPNAVIPSTHPWRVLGLVFNWFSDVITQYDNLKAEESSDLLIALTHLGSASDKLIAEQYPYFDLIVGGHSHEVINESVNGIPIVQAGSYGRFLGKIDLKILDKKIVGRTNTLINLDEYTDEDETLAKVIADYNNAPEFEEVVGNATSFLSTTEIGCFYTTALKDYLGTDCSFQNGGGIRSTINQGDITTLEIYQVDPFNNGSVVYTMTVGEIKQFFQETGAGEHVSGISLVQEQNVLRVYDEAGNELQDSKVLTIGINDYIPAVYDKYFPLEKADRKDFTTAEALIGYLKTINSTVDDEGCNRYFRYQ